MPRETTFVIKKAYLLSAINKKGQRVYYCVDRHSGGWPYWGSDFNAEEFSSLDRIPTVGGSDSYLQKEVVATEVLEVTHRARVVSTTEIVSKARAQAMAEIARIEKELSEKVAALEGIK